MRWKPEVLTLVMAALMAMAGFARGQDSPQAPAPAAGRPVRIHLPDSQDKLTGGKPISLPNPVYPTLARQQGVQGDVVLHVIVGTDGAVKNISVLSGDPLLIQAAMDAVKQWKYEPTLLTGDPVELDTTITVTFKLDENGPDRQMTTREGSPASSASPGASSGVDPLLKADVLRLLDAMQPRDKQSSAARAASSPIFLKLLAELPPTPNRAKIASTMTDKYIAWLQSDEVRNRIVPVYAEFLSDDDIKALTAFYLTPAGQHYSAVSFQIEVAVGLATITAGTDYFPELGKELCDEYPELRAQPDFCPTIGPPQSNQNLPNEPALTPRSGIKQ
jgi:TonB family protein